MTFDRFSWLNAWIDDSSLSTGAKAVLAVLLRHMGQSGKAWPSTPKIAELAGFAKPRSATRYLREIIASGYITTANRPGKSTVYHATHPCPKEAVPQNGSTASKGQCPDEAPLPQKGSTPLPQKGSTPLPQKGRRTDYEQNKEQTNEEEAREEAATGDVTGYENALATDDPSLLIRRLADQFGLAVSVGTEAVIWQAVRAHLSPELTRQYLAFKIPQLAVGQQAKGKPYTARGVMEALRADAPKWKPETTTGSAKRSDIRGSSFWDTEDAKAWRTPESDSKAFPLINVSIPPGKPS